MMTKMMRSVVNDGTAGRLRYKYEINNDIAGKTGTTQNHSDGWFMCYTPNLVCGAWVGGMTPAVRFRDMSLGQGAYMALPVCALFLQKLYKNPAYTALKSEKFPEPSKWVKDSMNCDPKSYSQEELAEMEERERARDSINIETDSLFQVSPEEVKQPEKKRNKNGFFRRLFRPRQPSSPNSPKPNETSTNEPIIILESKPKNVPNPKKSN